MRLESDLTYETHTFKTIRSSYNGPLLQHHNNPTSYIFESEYELGNW